LHSLQTTHTISNMKRIPLSDQIRQAVRESGRSGYDIAKEMNVAPSTLHRFVHGTSGLSQELLDRLADALDLHVIVGTRRKGE
jgi:plasmid maintenance system antidote protein VapI